MGKLLLLFEAMSLYFVILTCLGGTTNTRYKSGRFPN